MREMKIVVVGLGYVGLPLAIEFARHFPVAGFDVNKEKIRQLREGIDPTHEVGDGAVASTRAVFSDDPRCIADANFIVVAVPTPITDDYLPDLSLVESASEIVGKHIVAGSIVVYESTVYPGCTEEVCVPIIEKESGLRHGIDFKVGYSPERVNPGDHEHTIDRIMKVVSGWDNESTKVIAFVYGKAIPAGIFIAKDIRTAEAAKVIENIQRDLNIALVNELSLVFDRMNLSTRDVLAAAATKWNFHRYHPGLVGGHCIGVDPYYLVYKADKIGYKTRVILAGREINEYMPVHIAEKTIELLQKSGKSLALAKVLVLGLTFKEDVNDYRNSKIATTISYLHNKGVEVHGHDPLLERSIVEKKFKALYSDARTGSFDAILYVNNHKAFAPLSLARLRQLSNEKPVLIDVKMRFSPEEARKLGFLYWSL